MFWKFLLLLVTEETSDDSWSSLWAASLRSLLPLLSHLGGNLEHFWMLERVAPTFRVAEEGEVIISSSFVWTLSPKTGDLAGTTQLLGQSRSWD